MGLRMMGDWPTEDDPKTGKTVIEALVRMALTQSATRDFEGYARLWATGMGPQRQQTVRRSKRGAEYKQAVTARLNQPDEFASY
ncbi:MAG: hypothetical protein H7Z41_10440 [Cytophagales bacterium]|nr:hypothetical protein [Armatimonadota bacterium]